MRSVEKQTKPYDEPTFLRIKNAASVPDTDLEISLKWMLLSITIDRKLKKVFEMYTYFRDHQPEEKEKLECLHRILTHTTLDEPWNEILSKAQRGETGKCYKAFGGVPVYKQEQHRHPFFILAGAYYYYRCSKRYPAISAANEAIVYLHNGERDKALKVFKEKFFYFKPRDEFEKFCQTMILKQVEALESLDNLDDPHNDKRINEGFYRIREQITTLRDIYTKELNMGIKYGCPRCYIATQCVDLQAVSLLIHTNANLLTSDITELFQRIENRSEIATQEYYTVGALLSGISYLRLAEAMHKQEQIINAAIPAYTLFAVPKPCGFSHDRPASPKSQRLQILHTHLQQKKRTYFNKALCALEQAEALETTGENTAHTYNTTAGKGLSSTYLLTQKGTKYENIACLKEYVKDLMARQCPTIKLNHDGHSCDKEALHF